MSDSHRLARRLCPRRHALPLALVSRVHRPALVPARGPRRVRKHDGLRGRRVRVGLARARAHARAHARADARAHAWLVRHAGRRGRLRDRHGRRLLRAARRRARGAARRGPAGRLPRVDRARLPRLPRRRRRALRHERRDRRVGHERRPADVRAARGAAPRRRVGLDGRHPGLHARPLVGSRGRACAAEGATRFSSTWRWSTPRCSPCTRPRSPSPSATRSTGTRARTTPISASGDVSRRPAWASPRLLCWSRARAHGACCARSRDQYSTAAPTPSTPASTASVPRCGAPTIATTMTANCTSVVSLPSRSARRSRSGCSA
jgi:hypothetical protein